MNKKQKELQRKVKTNKQMKRKQVGKKIKPELTS